MVRELTKNEQLVYEKLKGYPGKTYWLLNGALHQLSPFGCGVDGAPIKFVLLGIFDGLSYSVFEDFEELIIWMGNNWKEVEYKGNVITKIEIKDEGW